MRGLVSSEGCVTSEVLSLASRNVVGCTLHPSDLLLLLSIPAQAGNRRRARSLMRWLTCKS